MNSTIIKADQEMDKRTDCGMNFCLLYYYYTLRMNGIQKSYPSERSLWWVSKWAGSLVEWKWPALTSAQDGQAARRMDRWIDGNPRDVLLFLLLPIQNYPFVARGSVCGWWRSAALNAWDAGRRRRKRHYNSLGVYYCLWTWWWRSDERRRYCEIHAARSH